MQAVNYVTASSTVVVIAATTALTARMQVFAIAGTVALISSLHSMASCTQVMFLARVGNSIVAHHQRRVHHMQLRHGVSHYKGQTSSELRMRVAYSAQSARAVIDSLATGRVRDKLTLIGLIAVIIYQQPTLYFLSMVFGPIAVLGVRVILNRVRRIMNLELGAPTEIINVVREASVGIRVVKGFAPDHRMASRMNNAVGQVERRANSLSRLKAATSAAGRNFGRFCHSRGDRATCFQHLGTDVTRPGNIPAQVTDRHW